MEHDSPICAALGHFVGTVVVVYCPHHQAWTLVWRAGDDSDDSYLDGGVHRFGPFDSTDDVANRASSVVQMLCRSRSRQWLASRQEDNPVDPQAD